MIISIVIMTHIIIIIIVIIISWGSPGLPLADLLNSSPSPDY